MTDESKTDPTNEMAEHQEFNDRICKKCGALIVPDLVTGEPTCNCNSKSEDLAKLVAANRSARAKQTKTTPTLNESPAVESKVDNDPANVAPQQELPAVSIKEALFKIPGAPNQDQIDAWKQQFGPIYLFMFDARDIYVWRPMNRREWQQLQSQEALVRDEAKFQEQVVLRTVLWPKFGPIELSASRAGAVQTLFGVIMQGSYFFHPDYAVTLVQEL